MHIKRIINNILPSTFYGRIKNNSGDFKGTHQATVNGWSLFWCPLYRVFCFPGINVSVASRFWFWTDVRTPCVKIMTNLFGRGLVGSINDLNQKDCGFFCIVFDSHIELAIWQNNIFCHQISHIWLFCLTAIEVFRFGTCSTTGLEKPHSHKL